MPNVSRREVGLLGMGLLATGVLGADGAVTDAADQRLPAPRGSPAASRSCRSWPTPTTTSTS
ncbi:hypothetical protein ACFQ9X_52410 [Catenulispora yoronensis]